MKKIILTLAIATFSTSALAQSLKCPNGPTNASFDIGSKKVSYKFACPDKKFVSIEFEKRFNTFKEVDCKEIAKQVEAMTDELVSICMFNQYQSEFDQLIADHSQNEEQVSDAELKAKQQQKLAESNKKQLKDSGIIVK